ncbi:hypothetical protein [Pelomonas sp. SE-A7]|uniref:hypothetical protein n=1 Tax=Pelomonas sp. SE-A7 TaxID=3054953 RepID=UPI00259D27B6|nr:hypothetical protein [Pelomonas sp. SE-A7]MDM4766578.1 hypothetical protein [Pelomonas sp. SE-A7]
MTVKQLAAVLALAAASTASSAQTDSLAQFDYQAKKAPVNQVVHYVKSNLDGTKRLVLSLHFGAPLQVEALKVEADGRYLALVTARLDPKSLTESWMRSYNRLELGKPNLQMSMDSDPGQRRLVATVAKATLPVKVGHLPAHIYNFDLTGMNATLPFLKNRRADFEVGILDPDFEFLRTKFKPDGGVQEGGMVDKGKATFRYLKDEVLDEIPTHRFEVSGPAFGNVAGSLWINAKDGLIERFEHALPDNPDWKSFRLERIASQPMNKAQWEAFKAATVKRAQGMRDAE